MRPGRRLRGFHKGRFCSRIGVYKSEFVEVSKVKKKATIVIVTICVLVVIIGITLSAFRSSEVYRKKKASIMWDCSVTCMEASTSEKLYPKQEL